MVFTKGKGPRIERETVITFTEKEEVARIWTGSETVYRRLRRLGYEPVEDMERSAIFEIPKKCVSLRKTVAISKKRLKALEKARAKAKARSDESCLTVQGQNGEERAFLEES